LSIEVNRISRVAPGRRTKAFVDIIIDDILLVKGFQIREGEAGLTIRFPSKKGQGGQHFEQVRPLNAEVKDAIRQAIMKAWEDSERKGENGENA